MILNRRPRLKLVFFTLTTTIIFFSLLGILLNVMEGSDVIDTSRLDDRVAYGEEDLIRCVSTDPEAECETRADSIVKQRFQRNPKHDVFRIIVTGGSFAMGTPYVHQEGIRNFPGGICTWLEAILEARYPSRKFEILNLAMGGANSSAVRLLVHKAVGIHPDLMWVATGNNEGFVPATPLNEKLHHWILYRGMKKLLLPIFNPAERPFYMVQNAAMVEIEKLFRKNLLDIIETTRHEGCSLALTTMPIHLTYPVNNLVRTHGISNEYPNEDHHLRQGIYLMEKRHFEEAITQLDKSNNPEFAFYHIGLAHLALGDLKSARTYLQNSVQLRPRNRTRPSFNRYIRKITKEKGIQCIDLEAALEAQLADGVTTDRFFLDYCHMTWRGYYLMAAAAAESIAQSGLIEERNNEPFITPGCDELMEKHGWEVLTILPDNLQMIQEIVAQTKTLN